MKKIKEFFKNMFKDSFAEMAEETMQKYLNGDYDHVKVNKSEEMPMVVDCSASYSTDCSVDCGGH